MPLANCVCGKTCSVEEFREQGEVGRNAEAIDISIFIDTHVERVAPSQHGCTGRSACLESIKLAQVYAAAPQPVKCRRDESAVVVTHVVVPQIVHHNVDDVLGRYVALCQ